MSKKNSKVHEPIRLEAKELGIRNWHLKKFENLEKEIAEKKSSIEERNGGSADGNVSRVSFGQLLDVLDEYAMSSLTDAFDSLDLVSRKANAQLVETVDSIVWGHPSLPVNVKMDWLYTKVSMSCSKMYSEQVFVEFVQAVCKIYTGRGWYVDQENNMLIMTNKPVFRLAWHTSLWDKADSNRNTVYRLLAMLSKAEVQEDGEEDQ
jgi:hypothetical protein